jgi:adhesin transport system outer membrane protein
MRSSPGEPAFLFASNTGLCLALLLALVCYGSAIAADQSAEKSVEKPADKFHRAGKPAKLALAEAAAGANSSFTGPASATSRCVDEDAPEPPAEPVKSGKPDEAGAAQPDPRGTLQMLVQEALARNKAVGAAELTAQAALDDIQETIATRKLQASANAGFGPGGSTGLAGTEISPLQLRAGVNVGQLLYDGGRTDKLIDWRTQLAESARQGTLTAREQLALNAVSLALERNRYRQHVFVYGQYVRKMSCLVEALETIVRADRGRASELLQARKTLQQAELAQVAAVSQARQVEVKLRRYVGDGLPPARGLSALLLKVPSIDELLPELERSSEIAGMTAQARAAAQYAEATAAGNKPQVSWNLSGSQSVARSQVSGMESRTLRNGQFALGVAVSVPLLSPGLASSTDAARKRAQAALMQRDDALEARRFRLYEVHEQTVSSFDRMKRTANVLRDSEQVRNFTLQQWQQLGKRSLFDVMGAEAEHYNLRISYINALCDGQQMNANLLSLGRGVNEWLR